MAEQLDAHVLQRRAVLERFVKEELRELEVQAAHADEPQLRRLRAQVAARSAEHGLYGMTQPREAGGTQATATMVAPRPPQPRLRHSASR